MNRLIDSLELITTLFRFRQKMGLLEFRIYFINKIKWYTVIHIQLTVYRLIH